MGTSPSAPLLAAGAAFSVTDTVQNTGTGPSASSTTRYYLSADATKSADDTLLSGTRSVPSLDAGASHTATVTVTIPLATSPNSYFLIACADDKSAVIESNEGDNCIVTPGAIVTVARPDLVETAATMNPAAPVRAPGTAFSVTGTARNLGPVPSASSTTRYYLSLDPVKGAGDVLLSGAARCLAWRPAPSSRGPST
jgi:subtilase family serine protease